MPRWPKSLKCHIFVIYINNVIWKHLCSELSHGLLFGTPWIIAHQAPLSMEFFRQEYWSRLLFPLPGDLPDPGFELEFPVSPALAGGFFIAEPPGKPV